MSEPTITHPCGHTTTFSDACIERDHFRCHICGTHWRVIQDPPHLMASGYVMPGNRRTIIEPQPELPNLQFA